MLHNRGESYNLQSCSTVKWNKRNKRNKLDNQLVVFLILTFYLKFYFK
jgi:hypothetical protein